MTADAPPSAQHTPWRSPRISRPVPLPWPSMAFHGLPWPSMMSDAPLALIASPPGGPNDGPNGSVLHPEASIRASRTDAADIDTLGGEWVSKGDLETRPETSPMLTMGAVLGISAQADEMAKAYTYADEDDAPRAVGGAAGIAEWRTRGYLPGAPLLHTTSHPARIPPSSSTSSIHCLPPATSRQTCPLTPRCPHPWQATHPRQHHVTARLHRSRPAARSTSTFLTRRATAPNRAAASLASSEEARACRPPRRARSSRRGRRAAACVRRRSKSRALCQSTETENEHCRARRVVAAQRVVDRVPRVAGVSLLAARRQQTHARGVRAACRRESSERRHDTAHMLRDDTHEARFFSVLRGQFRVCDCV